MEETVPNRPSTDWLDSEGEPAPAPSHEPKVSAGEPVSVKLTLMRAGVTHTIEKFFMPGGKWRKIDVPAMFALIEHPKEGYILFDTGYSRRFFEATRRFPLKIAAWITPATVPEEE